MDHISAAILATLCYSDVFDYPLTRGEIWRYIIWQKTRPKKIRITAFNTSVQSLLQQKQIGLKGRYYFLKGREHIVSLREKRKKISEKKIRQAEKIVKILRYIPVVQYIGISGSVALWNAEKDADIDLFIITKTGALWFTRLCILLLLHVKGVRRKRQLGKTKDMFCVNMLIDIKNLALPKKRHNVYSAHEIVQMKTIVNKKNTYTKFVRANIWVKKFLPHTSLGITTYTEKENNVRLLSFFEYIAKNFQLHYMKTHRTTEIISNGLVAFHPQDYTDYILDEWEKRKGTYGV